jgi:hypothetical protein
MGQLSTPSSVEALMAGELPESYQRYFFSKNRLRILTCQLKAALEKKVTSLIREAGMKDPPFDPMRITRVGSAEIEVSFLPRAALVSEASIQPCERGFLIKIDEALKEPTRRNRLRSSVAHELMHTFFYDTSELPPRRLGNLVQSSKMTKIEEDVCRHLARNFLMPSVSLKRLPADMMDPKTVSVRNLGFLKATYGVSSEIVAFRMIKDLSMWNVIFIKSEEVHGGFKVVHPSLKGTYRGYRKIKIPSYVSGGSGEFSRILLGHLQRTLGSTGSQLEEFIEVQGESFRFTSAQDTQNPMTLVTLIAARPPSVL